MSVMLPNALLGLRRRGEGTRNSHGQRVPGGWGHVVGVFDGRTKVNADGAWSIGLDMGLWPVRKDDLVINPLTGQSWLVQTAAPLTNNYDPTVDWVRVTANLRSQGGTEPGGAWFVGRYTDTVDPLPPAPVVAGVFTGHGPPPDDLDAQPGDEYVDLDTGVVYQMGDA